jgi:hypothetical protein
MPLFKKELGLAQHGTPVRWIQAVLPHWRFKRTQDLIGSEGSGIFHEPARKRLRLITSTELKTVT